jgi:hypothetical protein
LVSKYLIEITLTRAKDKFKKKKECALYVSVKRQICGNHEKNPSRAARFPVDEYVHEINFKKGLVLVV